MTTTDEAGVPRRYTYNGIGQLIQVEEPNPTLTTPLVTLYDYDVTGPLREVDQYGTLTRTFVYDWMGRLLEETHPESGTVAYTYFDDGLVETRTDARDVETEYTYDGIGRLLTVTYSDSTPGVTFTYDENGDTGFLTTAEDGVGTSVFTYDTAGMLASETRVLDGVTGAFASAYTYDRTGRMLSATYPSGRIVHYSYQSAAGFASPRAAAIIDAATSTTLMEGIGDNPAGQIIRRVLGNGVNEQRSFNVRYQISGITADRGATRLMELSYGYGANNNGRIRSRIDGVQPEHSTEYLYDPLYRLQEVRNIDQGWGIAWTFDNFGNRIAQTPTGLAASRVGTQTMGGWSNNQHSLFDYDDAGNVTDDGLYTYAYDAENRMTTVDSTAVVYGYDYAGRRVTKTAGGQTTFYFYRLTSLMSEFTTVNTGASTADSDDWLQYRVAEHTGTPMLTMAPDGTVLENNRVLPYGEIWRQFIASDNDQKFTSYDRESETDLDYAMARFYASGYGRFLSPDPGHIGASIGDPQSWNAYVYTGNDPINFIDPSGLERVSCPPETPEGTICVDVIEHLPGSSRGGAPLGLGPCFDVEFAWDCVPAGMQGASISMGGQLAHDAWVRKRYLEAVAKLEPTDVQGRWAEIKRVRSASTPAGRIIADVMKPMGSAVRVGATANKTNAGVNSVMRVAGKVGHALIAVGAGVSVYNVANAENTSRALVQEGGAWAGALGIGAGGAWLGAAIGAPFGGVGAVPGAAIGGMIGGVVGGVVGGITGIRAGTTLYDSWW